MKIFKFAFVASCLVLFNSSHYAKAQTEDAVQNGSAADMVACTPPPTSCNNCIYTIRTLGSGCVCGFQTGVIQAYDWDRTPPSGPTGGCSCASQPGPYMCTHAVPANCGARLFWRCR